MGSKERGEDAHINPRSKWRMHIMGSKEGQGCI